MGSHVWSGSWWEQYGRAAIGTHEAAKCVAALRRLSVLVLSARPLGESGRLPVSDRLRLRLAVQLRVQVLALILLRLGKDDLDPIGVGEAVVPDPGHLPGDLDVRPVGA